MRNTPNLSTKQIADVSYSYDQVADEYVARIFDELKDKPFDRDLLDQFAARIKDSGKVCDMGCGPGHVARYLHERGVNVCGVDLSREMINRARQLTPAIEFAPGNMFALDIEDCAWDGIVAFYSIINIPRSDVVDALRELKRVLEPDGTLLVAFHIGDETKHLDEWWGKNVSVDFYFFQTDEMIGYLREAGFEIEQSLERDHYPGAEYESRRAYIFAKRPSAD